MGEKVIKRTEHIWHKEEKSKGRHNGSVLKLKKKESVGFFSIAPEGKARTDV